MIDLDSKFKIREASSQLFSIAVAKNILLSNVFEMAGREVEETPSCESTISFDCPMQGFTDDQRTTHYFAEIPYSPKLLNH
jgi:hypothetical protein